MSVPKSNHMDRILQCTPKHTDLGWRFWASLGKFALENRFLRGDVCHWVVVVLDEVSFTLSWVSGVFRPLLGMCGAGGAAKLSSDGAVPESPA